jgi:outer membrane protein assembly factor BamB
MNPRVRSTTILVVAAVVATWFVARPAHGARAVAWSAPVSDGPWGLAADARGAVVVTSGPGVRALDRAGHERWSVRLEGLVEAPPALGGDVVLVGGTGTVTALARADGAVRWRAPMGGDVHALALRGAVALAGDRAGTLTAFDAATGAVRWSATFPGALWSAPRVDTATGAVVATWHQTHTPAVRVLDLRTGVPRWEAATATSTAAPVLGRGVVVLAIGDGYRHARVEARDLATGERRWQTPVPASFEEAIEPAVDAGAVAVVDHFGVVSLLDLATGRIRWQHDLARALIATRMALTARRVVFSSFSGEVFVLDRADGRLVTRLGRERLGGYAVALRRAPWGPPARLLVALRVDAWRVDLRRIP